VRCPYCHENITVQGRFCPKCGQQIFGRPVDRGATQPAQQASTPSSWQAPAPQASGDVLDIELEDAAAAVGASDNAVGRICPFCRFPIKKGDEVITCPDCQTTLHADCWRENGGCTTYGCSSSPQAAAVRRTTDQAARGGRSWPGFGGTTPGTIPLPLGARQLVEAEFEGQSTNVLLFTILQIFFCGGFLSIIGLAWSISLLSQIKRLGLRVGSGRTKTIAAAIVSSIMTLLWLGYFVFVLAAAS